MKPVSELKTAQDFIEFFEAIPEDKWTVGLFERDGYCCAAGHLGVRPTSPWESDGDMACERLNSIFNMLDSVSDINDGASEDYQQPTPKQRILAALRDAKEAGR